MLNAHFNTMKGEVKKPIYFEDNNNEFMYWSIHQNNCLSFEDNKYICSPDGNIVYMIDAANQGNNKIVMVDILHKMVSTIYPYTLQDLFLSAVTDDMQYYLRTQANLSDFEGELTLEHAIKKLNLLFPS